LGESVKIIADIFKFPTPLFPKYKHFFSLGVRYDVPPLKRDIKLRIAFPKNNKYELQYVEYDFTGWKDGDSISMYKSENATNIQIDTIFTHIFTKELAQRFSLRPVFLLNPDSELVTFVIRNNTGTSKVLWLDLGLTSRNAITDVTSIFPDFEVYPNYKKISYGSDFQFTAFSATEDPGLQEESTLYCNWVTQLPAIVKEGLVTNTINCKLYSVTATYNGHTATGMLEVVKAIDILPKYTKLGQRHLYSVKVYTFDNTEEKYIENPQLTNLTITSPGLIDVMGNITQDNKAQTYTITGTYHGDSDISILEVVPGLKIVPENKTVGMLSEIKLSALEFKDNLQDYIDVSSLVPWTISSPCIINDVGDVSNLSRLGDFGITAVDSYSNIATATLHVVANFYVTPLNQTIWDTESAIFRALIFNNDSEKYEDVSDTALWSSDHEVKSLIKGSVIPLREGIYRITATINGLSDTAILTVNKYILPDSLFKLLSPGTPEIAISIHSGINVCKFGPMYYDTVLGVWNDVRPDNVQWSIVSRGTNIKIDSSGSIYDANVVGTYEVIATYQGYTINGYVYYS